MGRRPSRWGTLEGINKTCELFQEDFPPVEVWGNGRAFGLAGRPEGFFPGGGYLNVKLTAIMRVSLPRDQASCLQAAQDAAKRLALYVHFRGKLFLV